MPKLKPDLSVVIPSFGKAKVIEETLSAILSELQELQIEFEIVVVVDGDNDATSKVLEDLHMKQLRFHVNPINCGKGSALKTGVALAKSEKYCALLDADLDLSPETIRKALEVLDKNPDIGLVLGSKFHPDSVNNYSVIRRLQSRAYSILVKVLFNLGVSETQTGFKVGRMNFMKRAMYELKTDGFAYDLELLLRLKDAGCKFFETPVVLNHGRSTTVNFKSSLNALRETFKIQRSYQTKWKRGF